MKYGKRLIMTHVIKCQIGEDLEKGILKMVTDI